MKNEHQDKSQDENNELNEKEGEYLSPGIRIFHSYEEQEEDLINEMAGLSKQERLIRLRQSINIAYGMHQAHTHAMSEKHTITFIQFELLWIFLIPIQQLYFTGF